MRKPSRMTRGTIGDSGGAMSGPRQDHRGVATKGIDDAQ
jgi:hypothetical protein